MQTRYNVYFAGQLQQGQQLAEVRARLARLFNADQQTLDKLFSGKAQLLKRDCDEATALKYKQAMERAGAVPIMRPNQPAAAESAAPRAAATGPAKVQPQPAAPQPATPRPMTAAERIAALAAAPDVDRFGSDGRETPTAPAHAAPPPAPTPGEPGLAPPGAELLRPGEQRRPAPREVDTSGLDIEEHTQRLAPVSPPPPPAPATDHLDMGEVGELIPGLPGQPAPPPPDASAIDLAPVGAAIGISETAKSPGPAPDLSGIHMAPAGSEVLEEKYRRRDTARPPPTDHISLEE